MVDIIIAFVARHGYDVNEVLISFFFGINI